MDQFTSSSNYFLCQYSIITILIHSVFCTSWAASSSRCKIQCGRLVISTEGGSYLAWCGLFHISFSLSSCLTIGSSRMKWMLKLCCFCNFVTRLSLLSLSSVRSTVWTWDLLWRCGTKASSGTPWWGRPGFLSRVSSSRRRSERHKLASELFKRKQNISDF